VEKSLTVASGRCHPATVDLLNSRVAGISKSQPSAASLVHAKLLLLGEAGEGEGDFGEQVLYFAPRKA
jgi:hypothetical protein